MPRATALVPLAETLLAALVADATLSALLADPGIYQGDVPAGAAAPYLTLSAPTEVGANHFQRRGTSNGEQIHVWAHDSHTVRGISAEVMRVLGDGPRLDVPGFKMIGRSVEFVDLSPDPAPARPGFPRLWHGVIRFLPRLVKAPAAAPEWYEGAETALFVEAHGQDAGSQIVISTVGPNGWLGNSPADAIADPTLDLTAPARWTMAQQKRYVSFGEQLADGLTDPAGFSVAGLVVFGSNAVPGSGVFSQWFSVDSFAVRGVEAYVYENMIGGEILYDQGNSNAEFALETVEVITPGVHLVGMDFDPSRPFGDRLVLWHDAAPLAGASHFPAGVDGVFDPSGLPMHFGTRGTAGTDPGSPESGGLFAFARGVAPQSWHEAFAAHAASRGW